VIGCASAADHPLFATPSESLNSELPKWVRFSGQYRARFEDQENMRWRPFNSDRYLLSRLRLGLTIRPRNWLSFTGEAQDGRVLFPRRAQHQPPLQGSLDLRLAYAQIGDVQKYPLQLRVGRQELTYSEERMLGVANWGNLGRTFNAVKLSAKSEYAKGLNLDVFAGSVVVPRENAWDESIAGDNLHGAYAIFDKMIPTGTVEPYFYWRINPSIASEAGVRGKVNQGSYGLRITKRFGKSWYASSDTVLQRGSRSTDSIQAWAAYWRGRYTFTEVRFKPSLTADCNLATGDKVARDGLSATFDPMYPTPHDKYGLADQIGWKNIRHVGGIFEFGPHKTLTLQGKFHTWWLHSPTDGVYIAGGALLYRDPTGQSGRHVGEEADFQFFWVPAKSFQVGGGVGHIFSAEYLKKVSPGRNYTFYYLSLTHTL
jgi:hypothetical protein